MAQFTALQERLDGMEKRMLSSSAPVPSPSSNERKPPTPDSLIATSDADGRRAAVQEKAFGALEVLSATSELEMVVKQANNQGMGDNNVWPNIVSFSTADRSAKWQRDMSEVVASFPSKDHIELMVDFYFTEVQVYLHQLHQPVFRAELAQFELLRQLGMAMSIDPAWLAQLASVIWITTNFLIDDPKAAPERTRTGLTVTVLLDVAQRSFEALESAFVCAGWLFKPQMRILQAIMVTTSLNRQGPYSHKVIQGMQLDWSRFMWFDVAVGICKALRLPVQISLETISHLQDPALPLHRPIYSVEIARRALCQVYFLDTFANCEDPMAPRTHSPYALPTGSVTSSMPGNYSDVILFCSNPGRPLPDWELTDYVWELHSILVARHWREIMSVVDDPERMSYEDLLKTDRTLRDSYHSFLALKATDDLAGSEAISFALVNSSYQQRFLRLHRPYLLRSYEDEKYAPARTVVLSAAKQIVRLHRKLLRDHSERLIVRNALWCFLHHISALLVIFINALMDPASRAEMRKELGLSAETFQMVQQEGYVSTLQAAVKGFCTAEEMIKVIDYPPPAQEIIEETLRNLKVRASGREEAILSRNTSGRDDVEDNIPPSDRPVPTFEATMDISQNTQMSVMPHQSWDIDWSMFIEGM